MVSFPWARGPYTYLFLFFLCSAFAGGLECAQVLFRSRFPLRSDALIGIAGCGYGVLLHRLAAFPIFRALGDRILDTADVTRYRLPALWPLFLVHYPLLILYAFLYPFDFSTSHLHFDVRALIPFYYHVTHPDYASVYVILRPIIAWLPAGIVYAGSRNATRKPVSPLRIALLAASAQLLIETGRAFTEYRYPDITNVLLATLGVVAGIHLYHRALSFPNRSG